MKKLSFTLLFSLLAVSLMAQVVEGERYNQYGVRVNRTPMFAESRDGIMVFESANQQIRFWFDIRVQLDGAVFFGKESWMDPIGNNVSIRRARFAVKSQINRNWYGEIDTDFSNGYFELKDALIRFSSCNFDISAGNFKEDFSMEQTTSSRYLALMERPMAVQTFAPSRHVGIAVKYRYDWFYASAGMFFQIIDGSETATWVQDANKDFGHSQGMSYTGKVVFNPFWKETWAGIHIGGGASYRTPKTDADPREYGGFRYSSRNSTSINRKKYLDTDRFPGVTKYEFLWNAELAAHYRGLRVQSEYIQMNNHIDRDHINKLINTAGLSPIISGVDFTNSHKYKFDGWYAMVGYVLFGGEQRYDLADAEFTQPSRGRSWGDIELVARYDYLNLNNKNIYGGAGENYTFGINYYVNENVKFVLNYQYSKDDRYANAKGDCYIGLDSQGNPTKNYKIVDAAKGKGGIRYHMLGLRMEIDF